MKRLVGLMGLLLLVTACTPANKPPSAAAQKSPPWLLASAEKTPVNSLVLVTVKLDEPEKLQALGQALQRTHGLDLEAEWPLKTIGVHCLVFRVPASANLAAALVRLRADDRVRTAEPMREYRTLALRSGEDYTRLQTPMTQLSVWDAHRFITGKGVVIGLVDTGVEPSHPDLSGQVVFWKDFTSVGKGEAGELHGTAMAGILAAKGTDQAGITGIAPSAKIMALRGCWEKDGAGRCTTFTLARAINVAIAKGVNVLNLSLTGPEDSVLRDLLAEAAKRGITVVAADNGGSFPASMKTVIGVPAQTVTNAKLSAPSSDVLSTEPKGGYDFFSGSSVASAHIAGLAALILEARPNANPDDVAKAIFASVAISRTKKRQASYPNACLALQLAC